MTSTLEAALLGVLARGEHTGYSLARMMGRPVGYFWSAHHSQIYGALASLEDRALVRHTVIEGAGPRPTKRYAITAAGLDALREFVAGELVEPPTRDLETLKMWSMWTVDPGSARALVERAYARHASRLTAYETELAEVSADPDSRDRTHPLFASRLTLEGGVRSRRAAVDWCAWMLGELAVAEGAEAD
ncbi:MAG: PadR family transcriptional regulator [Tetrasphaera sp.]